MADGMRISEPGWYDLREDEYHADPCPTPSLSSSCAKTIIEKSLMHAWFEHPRNPDGEGRTPSKTMDIGKAVHAEVFGGADIVVIEHDSFQKKDAREQRDAAYAQGFIPILKKDMEPIERMASIARVRFEDLYGGPFHAERVAIWKCQRTGGWRRGMLDTSAKAAPIIVDYKTTQASVSEDACIRRIFDMGLHIQSAAYEEAMTVLQPEWAGRVKFYFQWQEQNPPFAMSRPIAMSEAAMTLGREQWSVAGALWDAAVKAGKFPGYGGTPVDATPSPWNLTSWETRFEADETLNPGAIHE